MPKKHKIKLNDDEFAEIEAAINKDKRPEVRQRATAMRLLHLGHPPKEVASMLAVTVQSIYNWIARWQASGVAGFANRWAGGARRKADARYCQQLDAALDSEPRELGYRFAIWTVKRLRDHLEDKTGVHMSVSRLRYVIIERGYVNRRPKHDLTSLQDPQAKTQTRELLDELKKRRLETISGSSLWMKPP